MSDSHRLFDFRVKAQPLALFETPLVYGKLSGGEEFLRELEQIVRQHRDRYPGIQRSNVGGWHSASDMLSWGGEAAVKLGETAVNLARRMTCFKDSDPDRFDWPLQMWANITPPGGMNDLHVHPGNLWAAVLYLDMGDDPGSGEDVGGSFYVEDPRFPLNVMRNTGMRLRRGDGTTQELQQEFSLQRGDLILFPAWLRHGVRPYTGNRERISIAINIDATPKSIQAP